jgi:hypothetical protein
MHTYSEALELALISARNARFTSNKQTARELWKMAQEYQAEAATLGNGKLALCRPPASGDRSLVPVAIVEGIKLAPEPPLRSRGGPLTFDPRIEYGLVALASKLLLLPLLLDPRLLMGVHVRQAVTRH